jgi:hypothetical protein
MLKNYLSFVIVLAFFPVTMQAEWIPILKNTGAPSQPEVSLISDHADGTVIRIELSGFELQEFISNGRTFQSIDLLTDIFTTSPGNPEIPFVAKVLAIPDMAGVSLEIAETGEQLIFENISLPAARDSWWEGQPEPVYPENDYTHHEDAFYPASFAEVEEPSVFRDFRVARVAFYPVRYNPVTKQLQVTTSITVRVVYGKGEVINPKTSPKRKISPSFADLYRNFIFNYESVSQKSYQGKEDGKELMLCIMPDDFAASFQVYANWKRQSGIDVHVTKFSDIGANASNPDIIKNHISNAYFNWADPPTYVLIIGDVGVFPHKIVTYSNYSFPNEDFFVTVDGNDYFPEMMIGRFTNQTDFRMQVMINKFMLYEKTPYTDQTDWFKKGICCSNNAYASQVTTKRFAAGLMLEKGNFISVDTMMSNGNSWGGGCTYNINNVISAINNGRSYLNYRGEGWYSGWYASCYDFNTSHVSSLNNGQKFTFVTSIGCGVAGFHASGGNCFGEEWIQLGSLTAPRGAIGFIGPTSNTHTTYNNRIDKGIYVGMFQEGMNTSGQALMRGKLYMYNVFGNTYWVEYHYKVYCVLGDPAIRVWKNVPLDVNVSYPSVINVGVNNIEFTVTKASNGAPMEGAQVCLTGDDIFITGKTNAQGKTYIEITPLEMQVLNLTVTGDHVYPFIGAIQVEQPVQLVEPDGAPVMIELTGNMDGLLNPNENFSISYILKNWGYQTASNVQATLFSNQPDYIQIITTGAVNCGNISPGATATVSPFQFKIKPECPVGQIITFQLHVASSVYSWDYYNDYEVVGCVLDVQNFVVHDPGTANHNYRMDPGETVRLIFSIKNSGVDIAPNVKGILSCNDPFITIEQNEGTFGTLGISATSMNLADFFEVSVASNCPTPYLASYSLELFTQNGNYPYQSLASIQIPVSMPIPTDYTGPDSYGYYAYSSDDPFYDQSPVYNWFEIDAIGIPLNIPELSDYTETIGLPFSFKYYGNDYSVIRVSTDGWVAFGGGNQTASINTPLPNNDNVNNMLAVFWDDLYDIEVPGCKIYYFNDLLNHRFIIEWDSISHNDQGSEPKRECFQIILLNPAYYPTPSGDGEILFMYKKVEYPESNTVGIENHTQDVGLQYVFDSNYDATASPLKEHFAIKFTTRSPTISLLITGDEENPGKQTGKPGLKLEQNRPNPFITHTQIRYTLHQTGHVIIKIFNIHGDVVRTLHNGKQLAGQHSVEWDGKNTTGQDSGPGIYFYRIETQESIQSMKMFRLR